MIPGHPGSQPRPIPNEHALCFPAYNETIPLLRNTSTTKAFCSGTCTIEEFIEAGKEFEDEKLKKGSKAWTRGRDRTTTVGLTSLGYDMATSFSAHTLKGATSERFQTKRKNNT